MSAEKSIFETLSAIDVNEHTEKKNNLTYLSWAWAEQILKQNYPKAKTTVYENADGLIYHHDGKTAWVKVGVTIEDLEEIEYLPVMNYKNQSIPLGNITSVDVNKAIQRAKTKAIARHGLGLYIYAGEDLPDSSQPQPPLMATPEQVNAIGELAQVKGADISKTLAYFKVNTLSELTAEQADALWKKLKAK